MRNFYVHLLPAESVNVLSRLIYFVFQINTDGTIDQIDHIDVRNSKILIKPSSKLLSNAAYKYFHKNVCVQRYLNQCVCQYLKTPVIHRVLKIKSGEKLWWCIFWQHFAR